MKRTCPECGNVVTFTQVSADKQNDLIGRAQYACTHCNAKCVVIAGTDMVCMDSDTPEWENNLLQFARVLSEMMAEGIGENLWDGLQQQTGMTSDQLSDIFERAQFVWEEAKELEFRPYKARWSVACEDTKPLGYQWKVIDNEGIAPDITIPTFGQRIGSRISRLFALALNTEPRTMGKTPVLITDGSPKKG